MRVPSGFGVVTPYLFVDDAAAYVDFLNRAFGAVETLRSLRPDGCIANAMLDFSGTTIMVSSRSRETYRFDFP